MPQGLRLAVRLTPNADRDGLDGIAELADGRLVLKARVRAVPEKGRANKALAALLAKSINAPKSCVTLESGETRRVKTFLLQGDCEALEAKLKAAADVPAAGKLKND